MKSSATIAEAYAYYAFEFPLFRSSLLMCCHFSILRFSLNAIIHHRTISHITSVYILSSHASSSAFLFYRGIEYVVANIKLSVKAPELPHYLFLYYMHPILQGVLMVLLISIK
ncbi:hypothetical protein LXL04_038404, partial [Taraxacum kok-saghyz]